MKKINICLIRPDNYIHSYAFLELGELIYFSLKDLGFETTFGFNQIEPDVKNILIGCHLLDPKFIELSDVSVCETNRGTLLKEGFGSSFNLRSEDEIEI